MPYVPSGLSREDYSRFPSFYQNLEHLVATLQSNGPTFSGIILLGLFTDSFPPKQAEEQFLTSSHLPASVFAGFIGL
ncbi:hypothetical protein AAC387_Pa04g1761 [Persea americana]